MRIIQQQGARKALATMKTLGGGRRRRFTSFQPHQADQRRRGDFSLFLVKNSTSPPPSHSNATCSSWISIRCRNLLLTFGRKVYLSTRSSSGGSLIFQKISQWWEVGGGGHRKKVWYQLVTGDWRIWKQM